MYSACAVKKAAYTNSSVIDADKILVMNDGKIVGEGTHSELIRSNKEYQEIYYSQADKEKEVS